MPELVLAILKYLFLLLIFLFLARAVRAMYLEISGVRTARSSEAASPAPRPKPGRPPDRMTVSAPGAKPRTYELDDELIIGRADKCQVILSDPYASQVHARVFRRDEGVFIEDMGSTNGTYLNRKKVSAPLPVSRGDRARIGKTEMEFRR
ncbi:MAG: FHA domain-containing protein [Actinomycetota bacterium]